LTTNTDKSKSAPTSTFSLAKKKKPTSTDKSTLTFTASLGKEKAYMNRSASAPKSGQKRKVVKSPSITETPEKHTRSSPLKKSTSAGKKLPKSPNGCLSRWTIHMDIALSR
jgi:hypothetical protein